MKLCLVLLPFSGSFMQGAKHQAHPRQGTKAEGSSRTFSCILSEHSISRRPLAESLSRLPPRNVPHAEEIEKVSDHHVSLTLRVGLSGKAKSIGRWGDDWCLLLDIKRRDKLARVLSRRCLQSKDTVEDIFKISNCSGYVVCQHCVLCLQDGGRWVTMTRGSSSATTCCPHRILCLQQISRGTRKTPAPLMTTGIVRPV